MSGRWSEFPASHTSELRSLFQDNARCKDDIKTKLVTGMNIMVKADRNLEEQIGHQTHKAKN